MKLYDVKVMPSAHQDIHRAVLYIADVLKNQTSAKELLDEYERVLKSLKEMPNRNPISHLCVLNERQLRMAYVGNYVLIYVILDQRVGILAQG